MISAPREDNSEYSENIRRMNIEIQRRIPERESQMTLYLH
jgi:hypothetical protein